MPRLSQLALLCIPGLTGLDDSLIFGVTLCVTTQSFVHMKSQAECILLKLACGNLPWLSIHDRY